MINLVALSLVFTSLLAAQVWSPSPITEKQSNKKEADVIVKEGHRVIVVETYDDEGGQHNTKVSISPPQDPISTTTAGIVENTKEKIKQAAHVLPNLGQGLSGSYEESKYTGPGELVCDAFGKCTHKIARAIEKSKEKISEKAREAIAQQKEIAHEAKEKVDDVYEIAKETASQKAHDAKEVIEDEYEKAEDFATRKAQNVKETAKESIGKAQDAVKSAKDIGKTIGVDVATNVSEQVEKAKEKTEAAKNRAIWFMGSPEGFNSLMGVINLLGFSMAYGMCVWVTFISSQILANALTRQQFGVVQSKIYPLYFRAMGYCIGVAVLGHLIGQRKLLFRSKAEMFQVYILLVSILVVLINALYLEPLATKVMFEKLKFEKEEGRGRESLAAESSRAEEPPVTDIPATTTTTTTTTTEAEAPRTVPENPEQREMKSRMVRMNERLKRLNSYSSFLNILTLMALTWHLVYLSQCLHRTC